MSLKIFHLVFVTLSTLLCFGFGVWSLPEHQVIALLAIAVGLVLIVYGFFFWKKIGRISTKKLFSLSGLFFFSWLEKSYSCSTCYGDPASPQSQGIGIAVIFLGSLTAVVLLSIGMFMVYLNRTSRRAALLEARS